MARFRGRRDFGMERWWIFSIRRLYRFVVRWKRILLHWGCNVVVKNEALLAGHRIKD
jgi:hypothetical protein